MVTRKLPYYEIEPGIFEIDEFDCVSVFVIVGAERALVSAPGRSSPRLAPWRRERVREDCDE